jgi:hypothetical protein
MIGSCIFLDELDYIFLLIEFLGLIPKGNN